MAKKLLLLLAAVTFTSCLPQGWYLAKTTYFPRTEYYIKHMPTGDSVRMLSFNRGMTRLTKDTTFYFNYAKSN